MNYFNDFNILSWNIRGAANAKAHRRIRELIKLYKPSIIILLENHCNVFDQAITFQISKRSSHWVCSAVYANPHSHLRQEAWNHIINIRKMITLPWLVIGDFNEITNADEVRGGNFVPHMAARLTNVIDTCQLMNIEQWVRFGDRNTKFFHTQTLVRRKRNKIHGLYLNDGTWNTDPDTLRRNAKEYFIELFTNNIACCQTLFQVQRCPQLNEEAYYRLLSPVTYDEVKQVIVNMSPLKAPGLDGFQAFFYKKYWQIVGRDLHNLVQNAFS
uniref:Transposon TX1 uncharacterized n=1 Tax=Cajanus cajan TaxID=3821 RepID=A0A151UCL2_CAJCA|nr:Transposon TX1 uncharacterized [Cajanus cajan]